MIFKRFAQSLLLALVLVAPGAVAEPVGTDVTERIRAALDSPSMGLIVQNIELSEIKGLYQVQFENGPLVYASADGKYFVLGDLYEVRPEGYVNLGERRRDEERREQLAAVDREDMIVFSPEGETKAHITVFTDVTCFYCQKLHKEVPQLNAAGIEVRYLAYPRSGVGSDGYKQLVSAWCADNPQDTLTRLKNRETVNAKTCADNPVADQYRLGQEMGVRGTPALVTETGQMIPGYKPANELIDTLGLQ